MNPALARYANEIHREAVLHSNRHPRVSARRILVAACEGLRIVDDELRPKGYLRKGLDLLAARRRDHQEEINQIVGDIDSFVDMFLLQEARGLIKAGLRGEVAEHLVNEALELREELAEFDASPQELRERLEPLREEVCEVAHRFSAYQKELPQPIVRRAAWVIGGAVVVGSNATVEAITSWGMFPAATAISGSLGGHFITRGLG